MTAPLQPTVDPTDLLGSPTPPAAAPVVAPPPPPPEPVAFPLGWMLEHAALPLRYRSLRDVACFDEIARRADWMPLAHPPALALALAQRADGTWGDTMLGPPKSAGRGSAGVGTVTATRRLLEYGWDRESPPIQHARRVLFRLLAEDDDPAFLYEFASAAGDPDLVMRGRSILREASAAALAQAG